MADDRMATLELQRKAAGDGVVSQFESLGAGCKVAPVQDRQSLGPSAAITATGTLPDHWAIRTMERSFFRS